MELIERDGILAFLQTQFKSAAEGAGYYVFVRRLMFRSS